MDPKYYNVDEKVIGDVIGTINVYGEVCCIFIQFFIGLIFDVFGRKVPIIMGTFLMSVATITLPYFKPNVYPWYTTLFCVAKVCGMFAFTSPLIADYIERESMGLATSYAEIFIHTADLLASTVML
jgi:MFS family permease